MASVNINIDGDGNCHSQMRSWIKLIFEGSNGSQTLTYTWALQTVTVLFLYRINLLISSSFFLTLVKRVLCFSHGSTCPPTVLHFSNSAVVNRRSITFYILSMAQETHHNANQKWAEMYRICLTVDKSRSYITIITFLICPPFTPPRKKY